MEKYIKPEVSFSEFDLTSFLCVSIGKMNLTMEVDEYANQETGLVFDSDY